MERRVAGGGKLAGSVRNDVHQQFKRFGNCSTRKIGLCLGPEKHRHSYLARQGVPMSIRIVRLGSKRVEGEGLRVGTVRRPPRGVPKSEYASKDIYDVWLPNLSPSEELLKEAQAAEDDASWSRFKRKFRAEMNRPEPSKILDLLAALSHQTNFSVGCYCKEENRCHRSILRELLQERGAGITE
jgi:uncharacterized protein YeaO (DUF488 family)